MAGFEALTALTALTAQRRSKPRSIYGAGYIDDEESLFLRA